MRAQVQKDLETLAQHKRVLRQRETTQRMAEAEDARARRAETAASERAELARRHEEERAWRRSAREEEAVERAARREATEEDIAHDRAQAERRRATQLQAMSAHRNHLSEEFKATEAAAKRAQDEDKEVASFRAEGLIEQREQKQKRERQRRAEYEQAELLELQLRHQAILRTMSSSD